jgi:hypothetical protein
MNVTLTCQRCGNEYEISSQAAGRSTWCPDCRPIAAQERQAQYQRDHYQPRRRGNRTRMQELTERQRAMYAYIEQHPGVTARELAKGLGLQINAICRSLPNVHFLSEDAEGRLYVFDPDPVGEPVRRWTPKMVGRSI